MAYITDDTSASHDVNPDHLGSNVKYPPIQHLLYKPYKYLLKGWGRQAEEDPFYNVNRHYSVVIAYLPCYCPHQWKTDIPKQILHMYLQLLQTK